MAQRSNAYNFSGDLSRIGSALSRAMIGDAQDDANIARAGYYDAQKVGQEYDNTLARQLGDAGAALAQNPQFQSVIARAMNLDTINPQFMGPPSDSQIRTGTPAASNLARTFLGEYGNAEQMAGAASTYGDAGASRTFEAMIRDGDADQLRRGAIGKGLSPTKYFDAGTAQTEIQNTRDVGMDKNAKTLAGTQYSADQVLAAAQNEDDLRFGPDGVEAQNNIRNNAREREVGLDLNAAKERWANYKSDKEKEAAEYGTDVQAGVDRDKNKMADTLARWEHDNREIEMSVEPGKVLVLDPESGERLGLSTVNDPTSKYNGLYILDGGEKPGAVTVTVGKGDVYMNKTTADALGIKKVNGKYVIKGAGFETDASARNAASGNDVTISNADDTALLDAVDTAYTNNDFDLPDAVSRAVRNKLVTESVAQMGSKKNITTGRTFIARQLKKGFVTVEAQVSGMFNDIKVDVPVFLIEEMNGTTGVPAIDDVIKAATPAVRLRGAKTMLERLGYSPEEADAIVSQQVK